MPIKRYNNYHKHTHYSNISTLDSITKPKAYCERAVELGHTTYFTTEHGYQGNIFEAFTLCNEYNLKCIYGVEAYYVDDRYEKDRGNYHICLIAMNENGRKEINSIISQANLDGYYYKPRIDLELLLSLSPKNVVVTTACVASRMFKGEDWFEKFFMPVWTHFGRNFFLEVQDHNHITQINHNKMILELRNRYDIPIIHANDSHYILPEDKKYRDLFLKAKGFNYGDEDSFILDYPDYDTIVERYKRQGVLSEKEIAEALDSTLVFDDSTGIYLDKEFKIPKITDGDSNEELKKIIAQAWKRERNNVPTELWKHYKDEIEYEYGMIEKCGMPDYFILDHLIVKRAIEEYNAVLTRTGRGSAVSYYINKLLGLTELDRIWCPVKLYPTRFLSDTRILQSRSLPDIDLNWATVEPVIKASQDYLGEDGIRQMVSFKPMQNSSAFRLWCKAIGMDIKEYDDVAKDLGEYKKEYKGVYKDHPKWGKIINDSQIFKGVIESIAPSPCSYLLLDKPISQEIGLLSIGSGDKKVICCSLDGYNCDVYKYLKNDYLIVTCWDIISRVYKKIGQPIDDIKTLLSKCNEKVWDLYANGITATLNQADTDYDKQILSKYKPRSFEEMSAYVAAIRPGFASQLNSFVNREEYTTGVKELDDILQDSFHYIMYQENIMTYLTWLGIPEKDTYDIIKKISKKKFTDEQLEELKSKLKDGWLKQVGKEEGFDKTWEAVELSAKYSFNASHSTSVALDSIYGAYLKVNYPLEYYETVFSIYSGDLSKTANLTNELSYFGIKLKPIMFGKSGADYSANKSENCIYKGVASIKYCNPQIAEELLQLSKNKYTNFIDLIRDIKEKTSVDTRQLTILTGLDYFKQFGCNQYLLNIIDLYDRIAIRKQINRNDVEKLGVPEYLLEKYSAKQTKSLYKEIDNIGLLKEMIGQLENKPMNIIDNVKFEMEYLEYVTYTNPNASDEYYIIIDFIQGKDAAKPRFTARNIKTGGEVKSRIKRGNVFKTKPFGMFSVLKIKEFDLEFKRKLEGDDWVVTDETEPILNDYEVIK